MVVFPFPDALVGFRGSILAVCTGEPVFLDRRALALGCFRGFLRARTKVESKVRSLESPALARPWGHR